MAEKDCIIPSDEFIDLNFEMIEAFLNAFVDDDWRLHLARANIKAAKLLVVKTVEDMREQ